MTILVFFLEEPSAKAMLEGLLPRILPQEIHCRYIVFQGKQDLEKNLVKRLRNWQQSNSVFLILRDQDAGNCQTIKSNLIALCEQANRPDTLVRIACRELESFYLGDLSAVEQGLMLTGLSRLQNNRKYRAPDRLANPAQELTRLTRHRYQKVAGSRAIAPHLDPATNTSESFKVLLSGIQRLVGTSIHT